jgi:hypothetical protein
MQPAQRVNESSSMLVAFRTADLRQFFKVYARAGLLDA